MGENQANKPPRASKSNIATTKKAVVLFVAGASFIAFSLLFKAIVDYMINKEIKANIILKPGQTLRYEQWKFPTVPIFVSFYVFTVVNHMEVKQGEKPFVKQRGPYSYRQYLEKKNISFGEDGSNVTYNQRSWFVFSKETSCSNCDPYRDLITSVNVPYVIMAQVAQQYPPSVRIVIDAFLSANREELFMKRTVQEVIWGYDDKIFELFAEWKKKYRIAFIPDISPDVNLQPNDTFDGEVTVNTGLRDIKLVSTWEEWRGLKSVGLWKSVYANELNGSDGTQFPPGTTRGDTLYFFNPSLCRSLFIRYDADSKVKGIDAYRFTTPVEVYQNATRFPGNGDFCLHHCYPCGIIPGSRDCKPSTIPSPIVVSTPHFLIGDPYLRSQVEGLAPDKEKHGLYLNIEPTTGIPIQALIRLQINAHVQSVEGISGTRGIREAYIPLMYFSTNVTIDDATADMMKDDIMMPIEACKATEILLYCGGGLMFLLTIGVTVLVWKKKRILKKSGFQEDSAVVFVKEVDETKPLLPQL